MRFCSLASGSKGNSWLVSVGNTNILIDCGISYNRLCQKLSEVNVPVENLSAVLITHEHSDHIAGLSNLRKKIPHLPIYGSRGTADGCKQLGINYLRDDEAVNFANLNIYAFTVPHDSNEPLQFKISANKKSLAVVTDIGHCNYKLLEHLQNLNALVLEFNHDYKMLMKSDYPEYLKMRISGNQGHLSNEQAQNILKKLINHPQNKLTKIVAAHLSENNNSLAIVKKILLETSQNQQVFEFAISEQHQVGKMINV